MTEYLKAIIYIYDLTKGIVTSKMIAEAIRKACGYELTEPVLFMEPRISEHTDIT